MNNQERQPNISKNEKEVKLINNGKPDVKKIWTILQENNLMGHYAEGLILALLEYYFGSVQNKIIVNLGSAPLENPDNIYEPYETDNLYKHATNKKAKVIGVDIKVLCPTPLQPNALAIEGRAEEIDLFIKPENVDAVVSYALLGAPLTWYADAKRESLKKIERQILEASQKILKPGGLIILITIEPEMINITKEDIEKRFPNMEIFLWIEQIEKDQKREPHLLSQTIILHKQTKSND